MKGPPLLGLTCLRRRSGQPGLAADPSCCRERVGSRASLFETAAVSLRLWCTGRGDVDEGFEDVWITLSRRRSVPVRILSTTGDGGAPKVAS